jgi:hypothetical protein
VIFVQLSLVLSPHTECSSYSTVISVSCIPRLSEYTGNQRNSCLSSLTPAELKDLAHRTVESTLRASLPWFFNKHHCHHGMSVPWEERYGRGGEKGPGPAMPAGCISSVDIRKIKACPGFDCHACLSNAPDPSVFRFSMYSN